MMKLIKLLGPIAILLTAGCASVHLSSFTDPDARGKHFGKVLVYCDSFWAISSREAAEGIFAHALRYRGVRALEAVNFVMPTRKYNDTTFKEAVANSKAEALLIVDLQDSEHTSQTVPIGPTTTTGSAYVTGTSFVYNQSTYTPTITVKTNTYWIKLWLYDTSTWKTMWVGTAVASGSDVLLVQGGIGHEVAEQVIKSLDAKQLLTAIDGQEATQVRK